MRRLRGASETLGLERRNAIRSFGPWRPYRLLSPSRQFVILTTGRTGSELLVELLDSHPQIVCDSEILGNRRLLPNQFTGRRAALAGLRGAQSYGFKLVRDHLIIQDLGDPALYLRTMIERGIAVILLERRDLLRQALSHVRATRDGYHYRRNDNVAFSPTRVDPVQVLATMYAVEDGVAFTRQVLTGSPHMYLTYEDDLADPGSHQLTADRVCEYLGVPAHPVHSDLVKITPRDPRELVDNFDEIAAVLSQTRYSGFLDGSKAKATG